MTADCLFCKIIAGEIPGDIVHRDDHVLAFRDVNPQAPIHILIVPIEHAENAAATAESDPALVGRLVQAAGAIAGAEALADYRLVFNTGAGAGQSVFHTHLHLLGGRSFSWPPG